MIDFFEIPRPRRSFSWEGDMVSQVDGSATISYDEVRDMINRELERRQLGGHRVLALQFSEDFNAPLCRVWVDMPVVDHIICDPFRLIPVGPTEKTNAC